MDVNTLNYTSGYILPSLVSLITETKILTKTASLLSIFMPFLWDAEGEKIPHAHCILPFAPPA